jgi:hypothetical protein
MLMARNGARSSRKVTTPIDGEAAPRSRAGRPATSEAVPAIPHNGNREEIERRAYEIYQERGGSHGAALDDWLQAERELRKTEPVV